MVRMKNSIALSALLLFTLNSYAQTPAPEARAVEVAPKETYYSFLYSIEKDDTFASVLRLFVKDDAVINKKTPLVGKIITNNPNVKDWTKLPAGEIITLYIPGNLIDGAKYTKIFKARRLKLEEAKKQIEEKTAAPHGIKGSVFYMASVGDFSQTSSQGTDVSYNQNSYGTFGFQGNYYPKNSLYSFASSIYVSAFTPADTLLPPNSVTLPPEIGVNAYGEYLWKKNSIIFHGGVDYEKFSAFNMLGIEEQQRIYLDRLSVIYLTAGISHVFTVYQLPLFTRFSISQSISTQTTSDYKSVIAVESESLSGMKALFYLNYKFTDKLFFHSMLKYHKMSGPSDLTSIRLGLGVGYILF
jgi:hypothetical protein